MTVAGASPPARLDEALAYLREARLRAPNELSGAASLALALALDRAGDHAASDAALFEGARAGARVRVFNFLAAPEDQLAIEALALEPGDKAGAQKKWETFLVGAGGHGPWASAARARLDALRRGGGPGGWPRATRKGRAMSRARVLRARSRRLRRGWS